MNKGRVVTRRRFVVACISTLIVIGLIRWCCGSKDRIDPAHLEAFRDGMSVDEVNSILDRQPAARGTMAGLSAATPPEWMRFEDGNRFWHPDCQVLDERTIEIEKKLSSWYYWEGNQGFIKVDLDSDDRALRASFHRRLSGWDIVRSTFSCY